MCLISNFTTRKKASQEALQIVYCDQREISRGPILKIKPAKKLNCTVHTCNGCECSRLEKVDPQNGEDQPSVNIEPCENFPLYGMTKNTFMTPCSKIAGVHTVLKTSTPAQKAQARTHDRPVVTFWPCRTSSD